MFSVAIENASYESYFTEKIQDCFATATIPIYYGSPDIGKFFNPKGIITLTDDLDFSTLTADLYYDRIDAVKENLEIVKDFLIQNNNWPYIKTQELDLYHTMIEKYNPYTINLDNFVTGTNNFLKELDKLNKHCGLNTNISESLKVYKSWVTARKLHLYSFFQD